MNGEAHRSIDVDVFKEILDDEFFTGDRIPNNLLMEDEVLLQFYDIASSRV